MRDINLLLGYKNEKKQFDIKKNSRRAILIIGILLVLLGAAYGALYFATGYFDSLTASLASKAASYSEVRDVKSALSQKTAQIKSINDLLDMADETSYADTGFFNTVSSALNKNIFLTNLSVQENRSVSISGKAVTREDVTFFVYALKETELFSDVSINVVSLQSGGETGAADVYNFTVTATLIQGGGKDE